MRLWLAGLMWTLAVGGSAAQELACPQVKIISPYTAGGATDVLIRLISDRLAVLVNRPVIIESRPGGGSNIGSAFVAKSTPDGCTLLANGTMLATFATSYSSLTYNPLTDLVPLGGIGATATVLVTGKNTPADDIPTLIRLSKEKKEGVTFATGGLGLLQHLSVEAIAHQSQANFVHVVYAGSPNAITDMMAGRVDFGSLLLGAVGGGVQGGTLKALAVLQPERTKLLPDVKTGIEQGLAPVDARVQFLLFAPAGTPKPIVSTLSDHLIKVVQDPSLVDAFAKLGFEPTPFGTEEATRRMKETAEAWAPVIRRLNIKLN